MILISQRVNDASLAGRVGQRRTGQRIRFHIDHNDMLAGSKSGKRMCDARDWIASRLNHNVDIVSRDQFKAITYKRRFGYSHCVPNDDPTRSLSAPRIDDVTHRPGVVGTCERNIAPNRTCRLR